MESANKWVHSSNFWIDLLRDGILLTEVNADQARSLFLHLADLEVFEPDEEDLWKWKNPEPIKSPDAFKKFIEKRLAGLSETEEGFVLNYFLAAPAQNPKKIPGFPQDDSDSTSRNKKKSSGSSRNINPPKSSDPSTLQIVKKYGRQVQSFMELEQDMVDRLIGKHTAKSDARRIFNFVLGKMKVKTEPRPWEQLSRRRHK